MIAYYILSMKKSKNRNNLFSMLIFLSNTAQTKKPPTSCRADEGSFTYHRIFYRGSDSRLYPLQKLQNYAILYTFFAP